MLVQVEIWNNLRTVTPASAGVVRFGVGIRFVVPKYEMVKSSANDDAPMNGKSGDHNSRKL